MSRTTEELNPDARDLDLRSTEDILNLINGEDQGVPVAVRKAIPSLARAVDETVARVRAGARVFYVGAGTSGRVGVLDASEISPTFGSAPDLFQAIIAGGFEACHQSTEASEDDAVRGEQDLRARGCRGADVVVGIAASGETPYTLGALAWARSVGALTISICCNPNSALSRSAEIAVTPVVGPEVVAGSTRMKAGTAQKLVLNMYSTTVMVRLGHVYSHWMINLQMKNNKLRARGLRILKEATGKPEAECSQAIESSGEDLRVALVMLMCGKGADAARAALKAHSWDLRKTVIDLTGGAKP